MFSHQTHLVLSGNLSDVGATGP